LTLKLKEQIIVKAEAVYNPLSKKPVSSFSSRFWPLTPTGSRFCRPFLQTPRQSRLSEGWGEGGYPCFHPNSQNGKPQKPLRFAPS